MNKHSKTLLLGKERAFLFLSIIIAITLLTGFPDNLKIFVLETTGTITGGAVAAEPVELKDYFIGLVIFAALVVFLTYLVHALRTPRPQNWYPQVKEDEDYSAEVDKNMPLDNRLERVNRELKNLRKTDDTPEAPKKRARKITKVPDVEELHLEHTLRKIDARLHGYKKPTLVLEAPLEKSEWDESLRSVGKELAGVENMKFKKAKVLTKTPSKREVALQFQSKRLQEELKRSLSKQKVAVLEEPVAKKRWNEYLKDVNQQLGNVDRMPIKNIKIKTKIPQITKTSQVVEQKQLAKELQSLHQTLKEEQQEAPSYLFKRYLPASREWQLAKIKKQLHKKGALRNKEELADVERRLAKIYSKNREK